MTQRFTDKTVLITGAAGGIGLSIVEKFSKEGAHVVVADTSLASLGSAAAIAKRHNVPYLVLPGDLTDSDYANNLSSEALALKRAVGCCCQ